MNGNKNITEFFTLKSFTSLAGASGAVWICCGVIDNVFDFNPKWLALALSVIISVTVCISQRKKMIQHYVIALLNGALIFSTAAGFNTLNNADWMDKTEVKDTNKKSSVIQSETQLSSIIPLDKPWFFPEVLVEENEMLVDENEKLIVEKDNILREIKILSIQTALLPEDEKDFKNKLDSMNFLLNNSQDEINELKNNIEKLNSNIENKKDKDDCEQRLAKMNNNYQSLEKNYNEISKDFNQLKKECAGYKKLKSSYDKLKEQYAQLKEECSDYEKLRSSYDKLKEQYYMLEK
ncbi:MAG: hypothetical protein ISS16_10150, partial [Ignavibacteria bacterium]|nr:hypothetical protein [Ignavibacteria bacterium]